MQLTDFFPKKSKKNIYIFPHAFDSSRTKSNPCTWTRIWEQQHVTQKNQIGFVRTMNEQPSKQQNPLIKRGHIFSTFPLSPSSQIYFYYCITLFLLCTNTTTTNAAASAAAPFFPLLKGCSITTWLWWWWLCGSVVAVLHLAFQTVLLGIPCCFLISIQYIHAPPPQQLIIFPFCTPSSSPQLTLCILPKKSASLLAFLT